MSFLSVSSQLRGVGKLIRLVNIIFGTIIAFDFEPAVAAVARLPNWI